MNLHEAICQIHELPEEGILFVEPIAEEFRPESRAVVLELSDSELSAPLASVAALRAPGTEYFLEVSLVKEFIESWLLANPSIPVGHPQAIERIISYALNDA